MNGSQKPKIESLDVDFSEVEVRDEVKAVEFWAYRASAGFTTDSPCVDTLLASRTIDEIRKVIEEPSRIPWLPLSFLSYTCSVKECERESGFLLKPKGEAARLKKRWDLVKVLGEGQITAENKSLIELLLKGSGLRLRFNINRQRGGTSTTESPL